MRLRLLPTLALAILAPACGTTSSPAELRPPDLTEGLKELGEVYKYRAENRVEPPARIEELVQHEPAMPNGWRALQDGQIVIVPRAGYAPGSTGVLAYEKDAPNSGGNVLLRNGTVKHLSASEFKAARH